MQLPGLRRFRLLLLAPLAGFLPLLAQEKVCLINMSTLELRLVRVNPHPDGESVLPARPEPTLKPGEDQWFTLPEGPVDLEADYLLEEVQNHGLVEQLGQLVHTRSFGRDDGPGELIFESKAGNRSLELFYTYDGVHHLYGIYESMPPVPGIGAAPESASAPFAPGGAWPAEAGGVHSHPEKRRARRGGRPTNQEKARPWQCPACRSTFINWQDLRRHWYGNTENEAKHSPEELIRAGVPGKKQVFTKEDQAKYHIGPLPLAAKKGASSSLEPKSGKKGPGLGASGAAADPTPDPPLPWGCEVGDCHESFPNLKTLNRHWWGGKGGVGAGHTKEELRQAGLPTERPERGTAPSLVRPRPAGGDSDAGSKKVRRAVAAEAAPNTGSPFHGASSPSWNPFSGSSPVPIPRQPLQTLPPQRYNGSIPVSPLASPGLLRLPFSPEMGNLSPQRQIPMARELGSPDSGEAGLLSTLEWDESIDFLVN